MKTPTDEQMRIAIAEACGWTEIMMSPGFACDDQRTFPKAKKGGKFAPLPDYLNSLDAMAEAEKVLARQQQTEYAYQLAEITAPITAEDWCIAHATARQRAIAFINTLGLCKTTTARLDI